MSPVEHKKMLDSRTKEAKEETAKRSVFSSMYADWCPFIVNYNHKRTCHRHAGTFKQSLLDTFIMPGYTNCVVSNCKIFLATVLYMLF
jgi:hypothetical protein